MEYTSGNISTLNPSIKPNFCSTPKCVILVCASCQLDQPKKRSPVPVKQKPVSDKEFILHQNKYESGDFLSVDMFTVKLLVDYQVDMEERAPIVIFLDILSIMTLRLQLFGLKTRCLQELVKQLQEVSSLRNGFGIRQQLRSVYG